MPTNTANTTKKGTILVTGGAGYIGSHTCVELLDDGYEVVVIDNLVNSRREALARVERITGKPVAFYEADVRDAAALQRIFDAHPITGAIHFAALKAVGESVAKPLAYYRNNLDGLLALLDVMQARGVKQFVFSSSATVYGVPERSPIDESCALSATNPYGQTKLVCEQILRDLRVADPAWRIAILRYFNPVGAHASGLIGEDPAGIPNNLMPYVAQVAIGKLEKLRVFGNDYDTPDGTGVRDYIHVVDLARGHLAALDALAVGTLEMRNTSVMPGASGISGMSGMSGEADTSDTSATPDTAGTSDTLATPGAAGTSGTPATPGAAGTSATPGALNTRSAPDARVPSSASGATSLTVNLGTGRGYSVLEVVRAFEAASGRKVPYEIVARRPGDVGECYANPAAARALTGWQAKFGIERMCADHWRWQEKNPRGF